MDCFNIPPSPNPAADFDFEISDTPPETDIFDIPDLPPSPIADPMDLFDIPSSPNPATGLLEISTAETDVFDIPDLPPSPIADPMDFFDIPPSPNPAPNLHPGMLNTVPETDVFDIPDLPLSPIADQMDVCDLPPSPFPAPNLHPGIPNTVPHAGPSTVDTQLEDENTAERRSLKTLRKNLIPYLPVILSRASLLRAQLAQLITERDFIKGQIDGAVTRIAEVDRYLYGLRALQLMRQEGPSEETGM
jgi:hypothetical protein